MVGFARGSGLQLHRGLVQSTVCRNRCGLTACVALLVAASAAHAQNSGESVTGVVRTQDGQPAADVEVKLQQLSVRTAADGTFSLQYPPRALFGQTITARNAAGDLLGYRFFMWQRTGNETPPDNVDLTLEPPVTVRVQVVDAQGAALAGVRVAAIADYSYVITAETGADGRVDMQIAKAARLRTVFARQPKLGFDFATLFDEQQFFNNPTFKAKLPEEPVQLKLDGARTVTVKLIDGDGQPIADTGIYPWLFVKPGAQNRQFNAAMAVEEFRIATDSNGVATFDWLPQWEKSTEFVFWPMVNSGHEQRIRFNMNSSADSVTHQIERGVRIGGLAHRPGGEPVAGVTISIRGIGTDGNQFGNGAQTGADGRYQLEAPADSICMLIVDDEKWAAPIRTGIRVKARTDVDDLNFELRTPTKISGRVTVRGRKPLASQDVSLQQSGMDTTSNPELIRSQGGNQYVAPLNHYRQTTTDSEGRFEFKVGPGRYLLRASSSASPQQFTVKDEASLQFNFDLERADRGPYAVHVVSGSPATDVVDATVDIRAKNQWWSPNLHQTDGQGRLQTERNQVQTFVHARSADGQQAAIVEVGPDDESTVVELQATGTAVGRLVAAAGGRPLRNSEFLYGVRPDPGVTLYGGVGFAGGSSKTDGDGRFKLENLVLKQDYSIDVQLPNQPGQQASNTFAISKVGESDVGDVKVSINALPGTAIPAPQPGVVPESTAKIQWSKYLIVGNLILIPLLAVGFFVWQRRA